MSLHSLAALAPALALCAGLLAAALAPAHAQPVPPPPALSTLPPLPAAAAPVPAPTVAAAPAAAASAARAAARPDRRVLEDEKVRIEETRVRGQIQRLTVHSKVTGGGYEIVVGPGGRDPTQRGAEGQRVWSVLDF